MVRSLPVWRARTMDIWTILSGPPALDGGLGRLERQCGRVLKSTENLTSILTSIAQYLISNFGKIK